MRIVGAAAVGAALSLAGCGGGGEAVTVFAAASLTDAFAAVAEAYDGGVTLNVGGSAALRDQIAAGAPADVFASADPAHVDGGVAFATNELVLAVPAGNPAGVRGLEDLGRGELLVGLCAPEVPCGRAARDALAVAGIDAEPDTEEPDVRSVLAKLDAGELDAGVVYRTDLRDADVVAVADIGASVTYAIVAFDDDGEDFVAFVIGERGRAILADHGFGPPP